MCIKVIVSEKGEPMLMLEKSQEIVAEMSESVFFSPWKKSFEVLMMQRLGLYFTALHEKGLVN